MLKKTQYYLGQTLEKLLKNDIKKIADILQYHSDLYYNKEAPIISDLEYDLLLKKLIDLEKLHTSNKLFSDTIGIEVLESSFKKVMHSRPMISLDNTYNNKDLQDFHARVLKNLGNTTEKDLEYVMEYKFDGLGVELIYIDGKLTQAITRGNGIEGEDVTMNVMQIANIPKTIPYKAPIEVRGEVVMPISSFNFLNTQAKEKGTKLFSNPRNAASGSLRMKNSHITKKRKLQFFAYDIANFDDFRKSESIDTYFHVIKTIETLGFDISSYFQKFSSIRGVINAIENFTDYKKNIDFEVDGLVIKYNDISLWNTIGFTQHHPKYAIAYKFPAEIFTTTILSVDHQIGRTGTITPTANLDAIKIGGACIQRATLHNYDEVKKLGVKIGDRVFIKRAGEVIPKIISVAVATQGEKITPPQTCPYCQTKIIKDAARVRYFCPNSLGCPKQISEQLIYAVGKSGFNIDGLGTRQIEIFLKEGLITDLASIFTLAEKKEQILALEGFQERSINNLIHAIEATKKMSIDILLRSLGIDGIGKKTAKNLSILFQSREDLINFQHPLESIEDIPDIGPEVAKNLQNFLQSNNNKSHLIQLTQLLKIHYFTAIKEDNNSFFSGKKVCITGSFEYEGTKVSREALAHLLEEKGGSISSSVSKNTDFLLAGDKAGSKLKKAQDLGLQIINLTYFYKHL